VLGIKKEQIYSVNIYKIFAVHNFSLNALAQHPLVHNIHIIITNSVIKVKLILYNELIPKHANSPPASSGHLI